MEQVFDALVIGAGHNGLVAATRLARAGLSVCVVERRLEAGGGLTTEEISVYGVWHNLHSLFHHGLPNGPLAREWPLAAFGIRYVCPPMQAALAEAGDAGGLALYDRPEETARAIARISSADAQRWQHTAGRFEALMRQVVLPARYDPPPNETVWRERLAQYPAGAEWTSLATLTAAEAVQRLFEHPAVQALVLRALWIPDAVLPDYPGGGAAVLRLIAGAEPAHLVQGGTHVLAQGLVRALARAGGHVLPMDEVMAIELADGRAQSLRLRDGRRLIARHAIISAIDPGHTLELLPAAAVPEPWPRWMAARQPDEFSVFSLHLALKEPLRYRRPGWERAAKLFVGANHPRAWHGVVHDIRMGRLPPPAMLIAHPTTFDPTQSPLGLHAALAWQPVPARLASQDWAHLKTAYAQRLLEAWQGVALNLNEDNLVRMVAMTPPELVGSFPNMARLGPFGGRPPAPTASGYPAPEALATHRGPVPGLYLCGAGTYPGGGITGASGYHAAQVVLQDLGSGPTQG